MVHVEHVIDIPVPHTVEDTKKTSRRVCFWWEQAWGFTCKRRMIQSMNEGLT